MGKLEEIKVDFWRNISHLSEIYQPVGMQYAFLSKDNKQCHPWIKCRDFLHDALRSCITGKVESIYGFQYNPKTDPPLDLEKMRVLVKRQATRDLGAAADTEKMMYLALNIVQLVERECGISPLSKLYKVADAADIYVFEGSKDWMESTFMISLYTYLIRLGGKKIEFKSKEEFDKRLEDICAGKITTGMSDHDVSYLKSVKPFLYKMVKKRKDLRYEIDGKRFLNGSSIGSFHNYTGIVSLCREANGQFRSGLPELAELSKVLLIKDDPISEKPVAMKKVMKKTVTKKKVTKKKAALKSLKTKKAKGS